MILSQRERDERIAARGAEYRAREITEADFSAYLFSMRLRGEDVTLKLREFAPEPIETYEERREAASREWIREHNIRSDVRRRLRR